MSKVSSEVSEQPSEDSAPRSDGSSVSTGDGTAAVRHAPTEAEAGAPGDAAAPIDGSKADAAAPDVDATAPDVDAVDGLDAVAAAPDAAVVNGRAKGKTGSTRRGRKGAVPASSEASPDEPEETSGSAGSSSSPDAADSPDSLKPPVDGAGDADPFNAFAPVPEIVQGVARRATTRTGSALSRFFTHEWTLAVIASILLAAAMTWPALRHPATTIPEDTADPTLQAWQMSWAGHILTTDPTQLWNANAFYPDQYSYAFSDTLLGYAPAGMIGSGQVGALVRYNIIYVLIFAFAFFGAYALVRQLGAGRTGAAVAGAAFAYAPWRLGQAGHLHVLSIGGIALALAMLARGHGFSLRHGYQPDRRRWGWALGGWLVAAWQISLGFGIGIPFAYALLIIVVLTAITWGWRHVRVWAVTRPFGWKLLLANLGGGLVFAAVSALMAYPYLQVLKQHPYARRSEEILSLFSPPLRGFFIAPPESQLWGDAYRNARSSLPWAPEMALLPGFFLYGLAFAGLFVSVWKLKHRILLGVGAVATITLAMGTHGPGKGEFGYLALYRALPGFDGIRTSGRLMVWVTLFLALLAAGAVSAFAERAVELFADRTQTDVGIRAGFWPRLATLIPLVLVLAEGAQKTPHPVVPTSPIAMNTVQAPLLVLPTEELFDMNVMLWSTDGLPKMVNGGSGFTPYDQQKVRLDMQQFPDEATVAELKDLNVRTVVVIRSRAVGSPYERAIDAPIDGLPLTRTEQGDVVLYKIDK